MPDDDIQRARSALERAVQETTSDVEQQVADIDERLRDLRAADGEATDGERDDRLESVADDLAVLKEWTDGQTYTKLKRAEQFVEAARGERGRDKA